MGPDDVRGDAVSPPEPDVVIGAVATRKEAHWLQMGLQSQGRAFRAGRYQIQGEVSSQGILPEERHRLQRGLLSHRQTYFHQSVAEHCSSSGFRAGADGCQDGIPPWVFGGEDLHGAAIRFQGSRIRGKDLFVAEVDVRAEAVTEAMVQAIRLLCTQHWTFQEFEMKDLDPARKILGMEIFRDRAWRVLHLSQRGYIQKVLERFGMKGAKPVELPLADHFRLSKTMAPQTEVEAQEMETIPYASGVGSLMYAMVCYRPNIAHAVSQVSRFMAQPGRKHWRALKWIFRYLAGSVGVGICYEQRGGAVEYSDMSREAQGLIGS
ncbi:uncharacterized protein [Elaeis guineensis]|uniref:uncharacterized protein n=1 Tax=Elaeis guineensis var. tenera TaxID=51953 RepID=UPI003C6D23E1